MNSCPRKTFPTPLVVTRYYIIDSSLAEKLGGIFFFGQGQDLTKGLYGIEESFYVQNGTHKSLSRPRLIKKTYTILYTYNTYFKNKLIS